MNDFESSVSTALHREVERTATEVDTASAAGELVTRLDRADRTRHRTWWVSALVVAGAAAAVVGFAVIGHQTNRTDHPGPAVPSRTPAARPSPSQQTRPAPRTTAARPTVPRTTVPAIPNVQAVLPQPPGSPPFALSAGPLLHQADLRGLLGPDPIVVKPQPLPVLTPCHTNPLGWGAAHAVAASFADSKNPKSVVNEYVLRFVDSAEAHRALSNVRLQMTGCPTPPTIDTDPGSEAVYRTYKFDESYVTQRSTVTRGNHPSTLTIYAFRVARQGNVVVLVEDNGYPTDRAGYILMFAFYRAIQR